MKIEWYELPIGMIIVFMVIGGFVFLMKKTWDSSWHGNINAAHVWAVVLMCYPIFISMIVHFLKINYCTN